jgi:hypothetical protein
MVRRGRGYYAQKITGAGYETRYTPVEELENESEAQDLKAINALVHLSKSKQSNNFQILISTLQSSPFILTTSQEKTLKDVLRSLFQIEASVCSIKFLWHVVGTTVVKPSLVQFDYPISGPTYPKVRDIIYAIKIEQKRIGNTSNYDRHDIQILFTHLNDAVLDILTQELSQHGFKSVSG